MLSFLVAELIDRNLLPFGHRLHRLAEPLSDLPWHHRRRNRLAQLLAHERHEPTCVASGPMYPFRYSRSRDSTSNVACPLTSSGMLGMTESVRDSAAVRS